MKKFLLPVTALAMSVSAMAQTSAADRSAVLTDSLSNKMGEFYGKMMTMQFNGDRGLFVKGLEQAINAPEDAAKGLQMGANLVQMMSQIKEREGIDINQNAMVKSFIEYFTSGHKATDAEMRELSKQMQPLMEATSQEVKRNSPEAVKNRAEGEAFLAKTKKQRGVKATESGLLYKVIKKGKGATFKEDDKVQVVYAGRLVDGTEFDSSKGKSVTFQPKQVVPGFKEALMMMNPGSKYEVYIPADLAYGLRGAGDKIGPDATLVFVIETLGVESEAPKAEEKK